MSNEITPGITEPRALIVGCGIAGPVLAMFLKWAGIYPVIYKGRPDPKAPPTLSRGIRDLALPFFLKVGAKNAERAYSYRVDWDEKVAWSAGTAREESASA